MPQHAVVLGGDILRVLADCVPGSCVKLAKANLHTSVVRLGNEVVYRVFKHGEQQGEDYVDPKQAADVFGQLVPTMSH